jgi:hypothetical protein
MLSITNLPNGERVEATEGKNLTRQFPWTGKGIEFYLRDSMQKTLQVELGLSKNSEPWHWENPCYIGDLGAKAENDLHMD